MTIEQLGTVRQEFKPGLSNLIAGIILGALMIVGGGFAVYLPVNGVIQASANLPFWTANGQKGWSWGAAAIFAVIGLFLVVGGFLLIRWIRSLFSLRVHVGQNGFAVFQKNVTRVIGWSDIVSIQETHIFERPPLLKGPAKMILPKMMSKSFSVTTTEGEPIVFDGNTIKGHTDLAQMIKEETDPREIPWQIVEQHV